METSNPKSSLVDAIKKSTNILVTVSHNPSVDALAAALGFSLMLNKLDKHATAVFSGAIPPAISFLQPEKNFEGSVSSLRDFIIALDKEKADRLRYKVEGDVVRIYITPYKTTITQKDLEFSEGDFNVDLVIALGVEKQSDLDSAISAHGRILHDATVATVNLQNVKSTVGSIDWNDDRSSSLCEMLMSLSEALQSNLLDEQIATALLTGIVAATDRFSNHHTSPRAMTMSAQLMAAGANQQLISEKLDSNVEPELDMQPIKKDETEFVVSKSETTQQGTTDTNSWHDDDTSKPDFSLPPAQDNSSDDTQSDVAQPLDTPNDIQLAPQEPQDQSSDDSTEPAQVSDQESDLDAVIQPDSTSLDEQKAAETSLHEDLLRESNALSGGQLPPIATDWRGPADQPTNTDEPQKKPLFADKIAQIDMHNSPMVGHESPSSRPGSHSIHDSGAPAEPPSVNVFDYEMTGDASHDELKTVELQDAAPVDQAPQQSSVDTARNAVTEAFNVGVPPADAPVDQSQPAAPTAMNTDVSSIPLPPVPPLPDFSTLPPLPPVPTDGPFAPHPGAIPRQPPAAPAPAPAPGQFQIPGQ